MARASQLQVMRLPVRLEPDPSRVIARQFVPGDEARIRGIIGRALAFPEPEAERIAVRLKKSFDDRHRDLADAVADHYDAVKQYVPNEASMSESRKLVIGACFTMEYSIEAAALFNPSMVPAIDQSGLPPGSTRFLMVSDNIRRWDKAEILQKPQFEWEIVQIGNCGSPLETEAGWLLLTHGVGLMRQYCIGATLLDRDDPSRVIGQTRKPLLVPDEEERSRYVPNVVYSCGGMIHHDTLVIPYAMSDMASGFATVPLADLLAVFQEGG